MPHVMNSDDSCRCRCHLNNGRRDSYGYCPAPQGVCCARCEHCKRDISVYAMTALDHEVRCAVRRVAEALVRMPEVEA